MTGLQIRDALPGDAAAIAGIYGPYVETSTATFEEVPPSTEEMAARMRQTIAAGMPYLVAEKDGAVAGYAYAGYFRTRSAYRFTVENAVYVAPQMARQGIGVALMQRLIADCRQRGFRQMIAVIGDSGNAASLALHSRLGFRPAGMLRGVGFKSGRWLDAVEMQLELNPPG